MNKEMNLNELLKENHERVMKMTMSESIDMNREQELEAATLEAAEVENPNDAEIVSAQETIDSANDFIKSLKELLEDVDILQLFYEDCDRRLLKIKQTRWDIYNAIEHLSQLIDYENETIALCSDDSQS